MSSRNIDFPLPPALDRRAPPPPFPVQAHFLGPNAATLYFAADGYRHDFNNPALLRLALTQNDNKPVAKNGDGVLRSHAKVTKNARGWSNTEYARKHDQGVGGNMYLAWTADRLGITQQMLDSDGKVRWPYHGLDPRSPISKHDKADCVEALVGAVAYDVGGTHRPEVVEVMRRLGVRWSDREGEDGELLALLEQFKEYVYYYTWG